MHEMIFSLSSKVIIVVATQKMVNVIPKDVLLKEDLTDAFTTIGEPKSEFDRLYRKWCMENPEKVLIKFLENVAQKCVFPSTYVTIELNFRQSHFFFQFTMLATNGYLFNGHLRGQLSQFDCKFFF